MTDIFNSGYALPHMANVLVHVGFGTLAIIMGVAQFFTRKGGRAHRTIGRAYLAAFVIVLFTALFGSFVFGFRAFLASLTLSAGYWLLSGLRVLMIRSRGPGLIDHVFALLFIGLAIALAGFMRYGSVESTLPAYIALGNLVAICLYDIARGLFGAAWVRKSWLNEHIYKMIGSHGALLSAAGGNLALAWQPWSIFLPTTISFILIALFILRHPLRAS
ncbi:MAG: hypothetical protein AAF437_10210 [Pseudomonadota bacterium]